MDPNEVLAYLNELGYKNITAKQLKEFLIDLKKLMKYDSIQKSSQAHVPETNISEAFNKYRFKYNEINESPIETPHDKCDLNDFFINQGRQFDYNNQATQKLIDSQRFNQKVTDFINDYNEQGTSYDSENNSDYEIASQYEMYTNIPIPIEPINCNKYDDLQLLYKNDTISSRLKQVPKKSLKPEVSTQTLKSNKKQNVPNKYIDDLCAACWKMDNKPKDCKNCLKNTQSESKSMQCTNSDINSNLLKSVPSTTRIIDKKASLISTRSSKIELKPKTSFIRRKLDIKPSKSDPVALYHKYQQEWKKNKIPGQHSHMDVRWAIREKMLGGGDDYGSIYK